MIRVTVELISGIDGRNETIGVMDISNDVYTTTKDPKYGTYKGVIYRRGSDPKRGLIVRSGMVADYPRKSYNMWRLIIRMLLQCFNEEKNVDHNLATYVPADEGDLLVELDGDQYSTVATLERMGYRLYRPNQP